MTRQQRTFGRNIRAARQKQNMSQEKLATLTGLHRNTIGKYERGQINARFYTLIDVARALKTTAAELCGGM